MPQHIFNVGTCLRSYYMTVSICCSALYTTDTSQMAEYTLNELTDLHLLYGDTEDTCAQVHRCGPGGSMRACQAAGSGSISGRDKFSG